MDDPTPIELPENETMTEPDAAENARYAHRRLGEFETDVSEAFDVLTERVRQQEITGYLLIVTVLCLTILVYELSRERP